MNNKNNEEKIIRNLGTLYESSKKSNQPLNWSWSSDKQNFKSSPLSRVLKSGQTRLSPSLLSQDTGLSLRASSIVQLVVWKADGHLQRSVGPCQAFFRSVGLCEARHACFRATDSAPASSQAQKTASLGFQENHRAPLKAVFIWTIWHDLASQLKPQGPV